MCIKKKISPQDSITSLTETHLKKPFVNKAKTVVEHRKSSQAIVFVLSGVCVSLATWVEMRQNETVELITKDGNG